MCLTNPFWYVLLRKFLLVGLKEACMPNFSIIGSFLHYYSRRVAGGRRLEELKLKLTQPSLAGFEAELGNNNYIDNEKNLFMYQ
jgi:hypothetical protein